MIKKAKVIWFSLHSRDYSSDENYRKTNKTKLDYTFFVT